MGRLRAAWLALGGASGGTVAAGIALLDQRKIQRFHGVEEPDSLCPTPLLGGPERIATKGGYHFDGDYRRLATVIRKGFERRRGT